MSIRAAVAFMLFSAIASPCALADDDDSKKRWRRNDWRSDWREDRWPRPLRSQAGIEARGVQARGQVQGWHRSNVARGMEG